MNLKPTPAKHCKKCNKIIRDFNKSGYCNRCYVLIKQKENNYGKEVK